MPPIIIKPNLVCFFLTLKTILVTLFLNQKKPKNS